MFVAIVITPGRPACTTISASRACCLAFSTWCGNFSASSKPDSSDSNNGGGTQKPDSQTSDATKQTSAKYVYTTDYVNLTLELAEDESLNYLNTRCVSGLARIGRAARRSCRGARKASRSALATTV